MIKYLLRNVIVVVCHENQCIFYCIVLSYVFVYHKKLFKELQEERAKRSEVERNVQQMQEMLRKIYVNSDELCTLQKTASRLKVNKLHQQCLDVKDKAGVFCIYVESLRKTV